jgi:hypothetical protein
MSIGEDKARGASRFVSEVRNTFDHSIGDRKFRPKATFDDETSDETEEVVRALKIASGTTTDSRGRVRSHRISRTVIFMDLAIRTE